MKTTLNEYNGNTTPITEATQNSADIYHLLCSLHSIQRFSPRFQSAGIKNVSTCEVRVLSFPLRADFSTQTPVFPRRAMEGFFPGITAGRVSVEHARRASSCACTGLPTHTATKAEQTDRNGEAATQWHNGKCCTEYGALLHKHRQELQGCVKVSECLNHPWWGWWRAPLPHGNVASSGNHLRILGIILSLKLGGGDLI